MINMFLFKSKHRKACWQWGEIPPTRQKHLWHGNILVITALCSVVNFNMDVTCAYPWMRSRRPMSLAWHWVGIGHPWHSRGNDGARRLRVECERRYYRHLLSSWSCRGPQQVLWDDLLYPHHSFWCCREVNIVWTHKEHPLGFLSHLWIRLDEDNARLCTYLADLKSATYYWPALGSFLGHANTKVFVWWTANQKCHGQGRTFALFQISVRFTPLSLWQSRHSFYKVTDID